MPDRLRIGLLAPEFPPMLGGMAELARGLATALAATDDLRLFTRPGHGLAQAPFDQRPVLSGRPARDLPALRRAEPEVDLWLAMNAGLLPLARGLERPLSAYFHGNDFVNPWLPCGPAWLEAMRKPYAAALRHALRRRSVRRLLPRLRRVFTNSHQTARLIRRRLGLAPEHLSVVFPGVGDAFFQHPGPAPADGPLRLLTVSRLSPHTRRKNVDGVLRAVRLLTPELDLRYTVVGDGEDRPRFERLARELGIADRVTFTGAVDLDQLLAAYRDADLFVLASKASERDVEGFGIVYLEAAAGGVPSICSRAGGATDAVVDGRSGLLIDRSTPESIADGVRSFVRRRPQLTPERARAFAEEFRWPRIAGQLRRQLLADLSES